MTQGMTILAPTDGRQMIDIERTIIKKVLSLTPDKHVTSTGVLYPNKMQMSHLKMINPCKLNMVNGLFHYLPVQLDLLYFYIFLEQNHMATHK